MPIDHITVQKDGKKQDVIIAMTAEEGKDRSYREYLNEGAVERTENQLHHTPERPKGKASKEDVAGAIKEFKAFRKRKKESVNRRYF